ncbi:TPA: replication protein C, IncQ-type, partial [Escherichia coli]
MISLSPPTICNSALPELVALGWTVTEFAAGKYDITRPKAAG